MHRTSIYPSVVERIGQRRGGVPVFDRLDSRRTAHIVVDLQNGFMAPGAVAECRGRRLPVDVRVASGDRSRRGPAIAGDARFRRSLSHR